jgi:TetR/AcrR family transcriptional repressor of lmrAB and yxaGH operons
LNQVVASSGVSYGSVYHQFPDGKDALIAAAVELAGSDVDAALTAVLDASESLADGCATMFDYAASLLTTTDFRRGCPVGTSVSDGHGIDVVRDASASAFARWQKIIAIRAVEFGATPSAAERFASAVVSLYEGSLLVARAHQTIEPIEAAKHAAIALAERVAP